MKILKVLVTSILLAAPGAAHSATFVGDTVNIEFTLLPTGSSGDADVTIMDPGTELEPVSGVTYFDIGPSSVQITYDVSSGPQLGLQTRWDVTGLETNDGSLISGLILTSGNAADVLATSFTEDSLSITIADLFNPPEIHVFTFDIETKSSAVPVPAGLPLLTGALGLAGLLGWRRTGVAAG